MRPYVVNLDTSNLVGCIDDAPVSVGIRPDDDRGATRLF